MVSVIMKETVTFPVTAELGMNQNAEEIMTLNISRFGSFQRALFKIAITGNSDVPRKRILILHSRKFNAIIT